MGIQSLPQTLELNDWLKLSLTSSNEIYRQIALEEMIANGYVPELEKLLINLSEKDPSSSCKIQIQWLLKLEQTRTQLKSLIKKLDITPEFVAFQIQKGDYAKITLCSQMLRKSPSKNTLELWRNALSTVTEPRLIETGLNILCKFGNSSDVEFGLNQLQNQDLQVVCAALSLLAKYDKDLFRKNIRLGLSSKAASVLLHSVHLLRTIDEHETIKYLSSLILNKNALVRQKALRELTLIDFDKVENLFWQYISHEDCPFLLVKAGFLATFNPARHFPFKIYDIMALSSGIKKHILQLILKKVIEAAQASGVIKNQDLNACMLEIKRYISNKKAEQNIRLAVANLSSQDASLRLSAVDVLSQFTSNQQIKALLVKQFKIETNEEVKSHLSSIIEDKDAPPLTASQAIEAASSTIVQAEKLASKEKNENLASTNSLTTSKALDSGNANEVSLSNFPNTTNFVKLTPKEQKKYIHLIDCIEKYPICKKTLIEVLDFNIKKSIILEILKLICEYGNAEDAKSIYHLTKSQDQSVVAQSVKTIGIIDLDIILPDLNKFLANDDPRIKSAAFEVYAIADKAAAVQYVGTMLKQTALSIRRIGLSLLPQLDYPSAEPLLWWLLNHETNVELQDQAGYMIAANPTKDGIVRLFEFTHDKNGEIKEGLGEMWKAGLVSAEAVFESTAEEIEQNCWDNHISNAIEEGSEKSDYKFKSVVGEKEEIEAELEARSVNLESNVAETFLLHIFNNKNTYISTAIMLACFIYFSWEPDTNTIRRANKKEIASEANFIPRQESSLKTQVGSDDWKEGIRSGAREIVRSSYYANLMQSAAKEQEDFREESKRKEEEYFAKLANDSSVSQETRDWAAALQNPDYKAAEDAYNQGDLNEAMRYYERAANNPSLNSYGRITAMQRLVEISGMGNDQATWIKWVDRLLKELKNTPNSGFEQVDAFKNFAGTLEQVEQVSREINNNPAAKNAFISGMKERFGYSEAEAKKALEELASFKHPFDGAKEHKH